MASESHLLKTINDNFAGYGLQKRGDAFSRLKNDLVGAVRLWIFDVPNNMQPFLWNDFDHFVKRGLKAQYYIRYADDFVSLHQDKKYLESLIPQISEFLGTYLSFTLHPDKLFIKTLNSGVDFLGWVHSPKHRVFRTASKRRIFSDVNRNSDNEAIKISYKGMLSHGNGYKLIRAVCSLLHSIRQSGAYFLCSEVL